MLYGLNLSYTVHAINISKKKKKTQISDLIVLSNLQFPNKFNLT